MKTMTRENAVSIFNRAAGNKSLSEGGDPFVQITCFDEEVIELLSALSDYLHNPSDDHRQNLIKEWADVQVTLSNLAWYFEFDGQVAFNRVHESNMSKICPDGKVSRREDGKVLKPDTYKPANMEGL